jgi:carbon-monoxide dehydrogenase iron sulfur subunit
LEKMLVVDPTRCNGCGICELQCSIKHDGVSNPTRSRIKIIRKVQQCIYIPTVCQQCETAFCERVCPVDAIYREPESPLVRVNSDLCVGCRMCSIVCPLGGIIVDPVRQVAVKCDFCDGDPRCARYCPTGALEYVRLDRIGITRKRAGARKMSELMDLIVGAKSS